MAATKVWTGYLCKIALEDEVGHDAGGTTIYWSLADWKRRRECSDECKVARVEVREVQPKARKRRAKKGGR